MEIWKELYIEVLDLVQILTNDFSIPTKNDCFHVNKKTASVVIFTYFLNEKKDTQLSCNWKKNLLMFILCKGTNFAILIHAFEAWTELGCESLYYALSRPICCSQMWHIDGILSQWSLSSAACITFVFVLQPLERVGRSIMKEKEVPDDLLVISCEEDYETCTPLLEKGQNHLHHTLHTISVWESRQSANIHEYPRCHHFQHRASTKWYSHPEAGVRKVNKPKLFKTIETGILSITFPP